MKLTWDEYFLNIAQAVARRSNCTRRQIGALVVLEGRIVSTGYNGTPRGVKNCNEGGCARCAGDAASGTALDTCWCSHAEENTITQAAYHGISVKRGTLYTTMSPCITCSKLIINAGIEVVKYCGDYPQNSADLLEQGRVRLEKLA